MALSNSVTSKATVEPTEKLQARNVQEFVRNEKGKPVDNPEYALVQRVKEKAEEIFKALGGKRSVKYEVTPYTTKDGKEELSCSVRFAAFGDTKDETGKKPTQTVTLKLNKEDMSVSFVDVTKFDPATRKPSTVKYPEQFEDTKAMRKLLEDAGLVKPFERSGNAEIEHTPAGEIRNAIYKAADALNKTTPKVKNKDGEEKNEYYVGQIKDTSYEKDGVKVAQESFDINAHSVAQKITVNVRDGEVAHLKVSDFSKYDPEKKNYDAIESAMVYSLDYLKNPKLDGVDKGLVNIVLNSGIEITDRRDEKTVDDKGDGNEQQEECPWDLDNDVSDDFADR